MWHLNSAWGWTLEAVSKTYALKLCPRLTPARSHQSFPSYEPLSTKESKVERPGWRFASALPSSKTRENFWNW
jgi:hypothetical protein